MWLWLWFGCSGDEGSSPADTVGESETGEETETSTAECGDGVVQEGEACDDGAENADDGACTTSCQNARCGDGFRYATVEECDDGNTKSGDGCDANCLLEPIERSLAEADIRLVGDIAGGSVGIGIASAGDVDGNGFDDLLISAGWDDLTQAGMAHVVFGPTIPSGPIGKSGSVVFRGEFIGDLAGQDMTAGSDFDGDGVRDLLVGAWLHDPAGKVYGIRGPFTKDGWLADEALFQLEGENDGDWIGAALLAPGDVDGDGFGDVLVSATTHDSGRGAVYVMRGPLSKTSSLADAHAKIVGADPFDSFGQRMAAVGDVDGNGTEDWLIGAPGAGNAEGAAYVIPVDVAGAVDLAKADVFRLEGAVGQAIGGSVANVGDIDGDGEPDFSVSARFADGGPTDAGAVYVFTETVTKSTTLADATAVILGEAQGDGAGRTAGAGDVNGDGFDDIIISASRHDTDVEDAGAAYLLYGPVEGTVSLADADVKLTGERTMRFPAINVSPAGDVDGDGLADLLLSATIDAPLKAQGAAYVVLGASLVPGG